MSALAPGFAAIRRSSITPVRFGAEAVSEPSTLGAVVPFVAVVGVILGAAYYMSKPAERPTYFRD